MEPFMARREAERDRCAAELAEDRKQHITNLKRWRDQKQFLISERGAWSDRYTWFYQELLVVCVTDLLVQENDWISLDGRPPREL